MNDYDILYAESDEQALAFKAQGREECARCGGYWFVTEGEGSACPKCWDEAMKNE